MNKNGATYFSLLTFDLPKKNTLGWELEGNTKTKTIPNTQVSAGPQASRRKHWENIALIKGKIFFEHKVGSTFSSPRFFWKAWEDFMNGAGDSRHRGSHRKAQSASRVVPYAGVRHVSCAKPCTSSYCGWGFTVSALFAPTYFLVPAIFVATPGSRSPLPHADVSPGSWLPALGLLFFCSYTSPDKT